MGDELASKYDTFYRQREPEHVYPVEFVVRAFLGRYPRLPDRAGVDYAGRRVLDLGFGDGRNVPLLANLGMEVHGVEIAPEICTRVTARMAKLGIALTARVGRNVAIPYDAAFFDYVLACHACYYVDPGSTFDANAREIARVTRPGGVFVLSAPIGSSYIMRGAIDRGGGHMEITADPYGVRNGSLLRKFDSEEEIRAALAPHFVDARIGACRNDFWGIEEHVWTVVCRRA